MLLEVLAAAALALLVFWLVFDPFSRRGPDLSLLEPVAPEETRRGVALLALKEIEFDKETGKLSETDYALLKAKYGAEALAALQESDAGSAESGAGAGGGTGDPEELIAVELKSLRSARSGGPPVLPVCPVCGPRPEADAVFCSSCGLTLGPAAETSFCSQCGARLPADSRFCTACGRQVAA